MFSKDDSGCIPADEMKFALMNLPGNVTGQEIDEMIQTVDKNGDGKISFSEFRSAVKSYDYCGLTFCSFCTPRVMMGGFPPGYVREHGEGDSV